MVKDTVVMQHAYNSFRNIPLAINNMTPSESQSFLGSINHLSANIISLV